MWGLRPSYVNMSELLYKEGHIYHIKDVAGLQEYSLSNQAVQPSGHESYIKKKVGLVEKE